MITAYSIAEKFIGRREIKGILDDPLVMEWLTLDNEWPAHDEIAWCSGFLNWICWLSDAPRSKSLAARSWLKIGNEIQLKDAQKGFDIVIFKRRLSDPGPETIDAYGHVGLYSYHQDDHVWVLGGNQNDQVSVAPFQTNRVIGVRRLE